MPVVPYGLTTYTQTVEVSALESTIPDTFNGWDGSTVIELSNGQIWQQSSYVYEYVYHYYPWVVIYSVGGGLYKAVVEGSDERPYVTRLQ